MSIHDPHHPESILHPKRPYSIDLTLELEHQLENESLPPTPAHHQSSSQQSPDPSVLSSIIIQLRHSLAEVSQERDEVSRRLSEAQFEESRLKDTLQALSEKCTHLQDELESANQKIRDDEDAIVMLRTKVEESRRGVMRLQSENRRMSQGPMTLDLSRASISSLTGPTSSKRASFTPLTGTGTARPGSHRRISSVSDSGLVITDGLIDTVNSPPTQVLAVPDNNHPVSGSRRISGIFRGSLSQLEIPQNSTSSDMADLRRELKSVKGELEETRHALSESNEAREASETCVRALREFIGQNNIGGPPATGDAESIKLPLPPTMTTGEEGGSKKSSGGWRFKLWTVDTNVKHPTNNSPAASPIHVPAPLTGIAPLSKKLGGFFSSRGGMSPATSHPSSGHGSDSSSIGESLAEPISPTGGEVLGAGVIVRDSVSLSSEPGGSLEEKRDKHTDIGFS